MSGKREENKRLTRLSILDAARMLFIRKGFELTRIEDLARQAEIGKGTVYSYFSSKEQILIELIGEERQKLVGRFEQRNDDNAPVSEQILTLFLCQFNYAQEHREISRIMFRESLFPVKPSIHQRHQVDNTYLNAVVALVRLGQQRGEINVHCDPLSTAIIFYNHYTMAISAWYMGYIETEHMVTNLRHLIETAIHGLQTSNNEPTTVQPLKLARLSAAPLESS
ncbi:TetR/AcrR family transcriptional regulator [Desulfuromonas acetoxidans]|uniref:Transcriptional regulator, TetR family n=1 Tax=Desulfuromonas acetoxidans (strain DSM 684 / 11070) TaxID=281689 RepID=Q1K2R2_DESA6|nr:TetR/AcrR family transcriptional regulator [Desulfuromonas acetoxidans]EAT16819.1 transcriptional regulator, TetR family [Desulfuromonas acetoxidans DSM 684]MBF0644632.1 TetR/AcrR family transcriptional regulator [Desulfuromonas acetoxidans]NVD23761.1 TetR/AcrR family transcriptional regulator [Desulfuromonas acetoxidans]NVE15842.1 TetR/AcrR family transcriptional regulator [Desulfuromonas acetoxidans]